MKYTVLLLLLLSNIVFADEISKTNELKKKAEVAYKNKDYKTSEKHYSELFSKYKVEDDFAKLNFAHSQYLNNKTEESIKNYESLVKSDEKVVKSISNLQLGNIYSKNQDLQKALDYYKKALIADPTNEEARFNAELTKKKIKDNPEQQNKEKQDDKNQDKKDQKDEKKENKDQKKDDKGEQKDEKKEGKDKNQDKKDGKGDKDDKGKPEDKKGENGKDKDDKKGDQKDKGKGNEGKDKKEEEKGKDGKNSDKKGEEKDKKDGNKEENSGENQKGKQDENGNAQGKALENMRISPEKAQMLLDAMKNSEKQYLQQIKKEPTEKKNKSKPDW